MGICFCTQARVLSSSPGAIDNANAVLSPKKECAENFCSENMPSLPSTSRPPSNLRAFSFVDLRSATRSFRPESLLGQGGFGRVFKGYINEKTFLPARPGQGMPVAIKKLNSEGHQGHREWLAEVHVLGTLHHPNLVRLIGFCAEDENRLLVYEFVPRGSLENHLFRSKVSSLKFDQRFLSDVSVNPK